MPAVRSSYSKKDTELLGVKSVELFQDETSKAHFTSEYESSDLVVRRGLPFKVLITLSRDIISEYRHTISL